MIKVNYEIEVKEGKGVSTTGGVEVNMLKNKGSEALNEATCMIALLRNAEETILNEMAESFNADIEKIKKDFEPNIQDAMKKFKARENRSLKTKGE